MFFYVIFGLQILTSVSSLRLNSKVGFFDDDLNLERNYNLVSGEKSKPSGGFQIRNSVRFTDQYFEQRLDHSRPTDTSTWLQRYFVNDFYYEEGGPIFLFVYGEAAASPRWMGKGPQWIEYAKKFNALCFGLEHRFYGKSWPKGNTNGTNLQYLTTEQVLADIAYFIEDMNERNNFSSHTKWILFGGSYAGSLVAWMRLKYPHLVYGAVASSAPLQAKTDFPEYLQVVEKSLRRHSAECVKNIAAANRHLSQAIQTPAGRARISKSFKLCSVLQNNTDDISTLFESLSDSIAYAVQYNRKPFSIQDVCDIMTENDDDVYPLQRYANVNALYLNMLGEPCVSPKYIDIVNYLRNDNSSEQSSRLWFYQTCSEYGYYQTSSNPNDVFGGHFPVDYFIKLCKDVFGSRFDQDFVDDAVHRTNIEFGHFNFNSSRVIFTNGDVDPWHALGITEEMKSSAHQVIFIKGTAHCGDMYSSSDDDPEQLKIARRQIFEILKSWLVDEDTNDTDTIDNTRSSSRKNEIQLQINGKDQNVRSDNSLNK